MCTKESALSAQLCDRPLLRSSLACATCTGAPLLFPLGVMMTKASSLPWIALGGHKQSNTQSDMLLLLHMLTGLKDNDNVKTPQHTLVHVKSA